MDGLTPLLLTCWLLPVNLVAFIMMWSDKRRARKGKRRIPEATLFTAAILGGSIGALAGMYTFRHKTKHKSFVYGMPAILIVQIVLALCLILGGPAKP